MAFLCFVGAEGGVADGCFSAITKKNPVGISAGASSSAFRVGNALTCHELTEPEHLGSGISKASAYLP